MLVWIIAVLGLYFLQSMLPASLRSAGSFSNTEQSLSDALGPRDVPLPMPVMGQRAERALNNLKEALPIFLTVALLSLILGQPDPIAITGATVFFVARVLYVPAYMSGVPGIRSLAWTAGHLGIGAMLYPIILTL